MSTIVKPIKQSKNLNRLDSKVERAYFSNFLQNLDFDSKAKQRLVNETSDILGMCHNPKNLEGTNTVGSVIGYVQSGKTTSFNALTMLAIDNGFNRIVLGGRTKNLYNKIEMNLQRLLSLL